jgi:lipopolysaccharide export LptBFGC system permease protein LptF
MKKMMTIAALAILVFGAGLLVGANRFNKPKSILHIVTVKWKADATAAQKEAALKGVERMAGEIPGVKNVWVDTIKVQGAGFNNVFVMEFADAAAFKAYADHAAHKEWEAVYLPIREQSTTHDATNK